MEWGGKKSKIQNFARHKKERWISYSQTHIIRQSGVRKWIKFPSSRISNIEGADLANGLHTYLQYKETKEGKNPQGQIK